MKKPAILVTGSKGQVGQELQFCASKFRQFRYVFVDLEELDITDATAVSGFIEKHDLQYCINCAAYTAVDRAETEPLLARRINAEGARNLALACAKKKIAFIQLSTDYVYHTGQNTPYSENDPVQPKGIYASTKLEGDEATLAQGGMVIRTSWVYSSFGNNFVKTMLRLGQEQEQLKIIFDQIGTPTYAQDLAGAILTIIKKVESKEISRNMLSGIYHYSNEGVTSWYDFAKAIFDIKGIKIKLIPIETKDYPTPAKRPAFSVLNKAKIKQTFDIEIPHWHTSLRSCLRLLTGERRSD